MVPGIAAGINSGKGHSFLIHLPSPSSELSVIDILYVDDDLDFLEITKRMVERSGEIAIETASSAENALAMMEDRTYDVIVSDYQMPRTDGIEFLKMLRGSGNTTPFIIFTGRGREEVVIQAYDSGADFYVQKGGDLKAQFRELEHKIVQAVRIHEAESALRESEERYRSVVENATEGIVVVQDELLRYANPRALEMVEATSGEVTGKNFALFVHPGDIPLVTERYRRRQGGEKVPKTYDFRVVGKAGLVTWVQASAVLILWNRRTATLALLADITGRKLRENNIRQRNVALEQTVEDQAARLERSEEEKKNLLGRLAGSDTR
ncbi:MAG: response regulator [Methanolinea sp.]|jgi:PAS domain S-box-containing protein|nr:response regulator [Methanolinea sp.]